MNRELCFNIENQYLYLEQVLVDYMDIPIFFLCKDKKQYYIALCTDIDELSYIVTKLSLSEVYNLLHGKIPMRDVFLKQQEYWEIVSGDKVCMDMVTKKKIDALEQSLLPEADACFKILTKQIKLFVQEFDDEFFSAKYFSESNKKADLRELISEFPLEVLLANIDQFTELADCKVEKSSFSEIPSYDEKFHPVKTTEVIFRKSEQSKQSDQDGLFKLVESYENYIATAA